MFAVLGWACLILDLRVIKASQPLWSVFSRAQAPIFAKTAPSSGVRCQVKIRTSIPSYVTTNYSRHIYFSIIIISQQTSVARIELSSHLDPDLTSYGSETLSMQKLILHLKRLVRRLLVIDNLVKRLNQLVVIVMSSFRINILRSNLSQDYHRNLVSMLAAVVGHLIKLALVNSSLKY